MKEEAICVPFLDLKKQLRSLEPHCSRAIQKLIESAQFVDGEPVERFEKAFAKYCGTSEAVAVDSGTAALHLALLAAGIRTGDEVICPTNTFIASAAAIVATGAKPVFVDADPGHWQMDVSQVERAITPRSKAVLAVHLYGQPVELAAIMDLCSNKHLLLIEDAAQAHGASYAGRRAGSFGAIAGFSFYPGKNLGAFGDGGAVTTNSPDLADRIRRLRNHGRVSKYDHVELGFNYRMDAIQAIVLAMKLPLLDSWNQARKQWSARYKERLSTTPLEFPSPIDNTDPVHHLFPVLTSQRDSLRTFLEERGIQTGLHYPIPLHLQKAFQYLGYAPGKFPVAERISQSEISLPIFPEMTEEQFDHVCSSITRFFAIKSVAE